MPFLVAYVRQDHEPIFRTCRDFPNLQFLNTCQVALEPDYNIGIDLRGYHQERLLKQSRRLQARVVKAS
jgi:hypothetical protein